MMHITLIRVVSAPCSTTKTGALQRTFTMVIKSFNGGPSSNQMEDANAKGAVTSPVGRPRAVQPDRGRVTSFSSFSRPDSKLRFRPVRARRPSRDLPQVHGRAGLESDLSEAALSGSHEA